MNPHELVRLRQFGLADVGLHSQSSNFWSKRNAPVRRKAKYYDDQGKFPTKEFVSSAEHISEITSPLFPSLVRERRLNIGRRNNKVFASQWLDHNRVVMGTKCNKILVCDLSALKKDPSELIRSRGRSTSDPSYNDDLDVASSSAEDVVARYRSRGGGSETTVSGTLDENSVFNHRLRSLIGSPGMLRNPPAGQHIRFDPRGRKRDSEGRVLPTNALNSNLSTSDVEVSTVSAGTQDLCRPVRNYMPKREFIRWIPSLKSSEESLWDESLAGSHSGIHSLKINPSRTMLATGGVNASDVAVYSLPEFRPIAIGEGAHSDWLFDMEWIDNEYLVSGSRDNILSLWRFRDHDCDDTAIGCGHVRWIKPSGASSFTAEQGAHRVMHHTALLTLNHFEKIRAVAHNHERETVAAVSLNSYLALVDLRTMTDVHNRDLGEQFAESVCMSYGLNDKVLAVGAKQRFAFLDTRTSYVTKDVLLRLPPEPNIGTHFIPNGVRSISWNGPLLTVGTGRGEIYFYDIRGKGQFLTCSGCSKEITRLRIQSDHHEADEHFAELHNSFCNYTAVYTHCYDPSGQRLFAAGGPISANQEGNYAAVWE